MSGHVTAESIQNFGKTAIAQLFWTIAKVVVTTLASGAILMATGYVRDIRDDLKAVAVKTENQDKAQAITDVKIEALQRVSDSTVQALRQIGDQVTQTKMDVQSLQQAQQADALRSRPTR